MPPLPFRSFLKKYAAALGIAGLIGAQVTALALVCPGQVGFGEEASNDASKTVPAKMDILKRACRQPTLV
jgi:hypothetical protein